LEIECAPRPPFHSGTPDTAPPEVIRAFFARYGDVKKYREAEARRFVSKLRISATPASGVLSADPEHRSIDDSWR
jgi:hypothetical protein